MVAGAHQLPHSDKADRSEPTRPSFSFSESDQIRRSESADAYLAGSESSGSGGVAGRYPGAVDPIPFDPAPDPRHGDFSKTPRPALADTAAPSDPIRPLVPPSRRAVAWNPLANRAEPRVSSEGKRAVDSPRVEYAGEGPVAAAASSKYGFGPVATTPNEPIEPESGRLSAAIGRRPLVPVDTAPETDRSTKKQRTAFNPAVDSRFGSGEPDDRGAEVERLPAIDTASETPQRLAGPTTPGDRIPIYPSTGTP
jgi:hypothetical protein